MIFRLIPSVERSAGSIATQLWLIGAFVVSLCLLASVEVYGQSQSAQQAETGAFYLQNFSPQDYDAHAQNWAVVQDSAGLMYVANGTGVLEYDGVHWRGIETTKRTAARSLAVDEAGTVYVGAHGDFGYLAPDSTGTMRYVSLLPSVREEDMEFTEVWRIVPTPEGVYYSTRERLFRWSAQEGMESWAPETIFALGFALGDTFYTVQPGTGLMRVRGDTLEPAPAGKALQSDIVDFALPFDDGTALLATRSAGFLRYDGTTLQPFNTEVDAELQRDLLYHGTVLADGRLALATRRGGLYLLSRSGELIRVLDKDAGLRDQHLWYAYSDREGSLWLALNNGIARVDLSSPLTFFDAEVGLPGIIMSTVRHRGALYAASSTGAYRLSAAVGRAPRFDAVVEGSAGQCLTLLSTEAGLLAGCEGGVYVMDESAAPRLITEAATRLLYRSEHNPAQAFAATREGLLRLTLRNGRWRAGELLPDAPVWALSIAEDDEGALWLTTTADGVARVRDAQDPVPTVTRFTTEHGLPAGWSYVAAVDSALLFHTPEGVFQFEAASERFVSDTLLGAHLPEPHGEVFLLKEDHAGGVWFSNEMEVGRASAAPGGGFAAEIGLLQRAPSTAFQTIYPEEDGTVWFGGEGGLVRYATERTDAREPRGAVQIRRVSTIGGDSLLFGGAGGAPLPMRLASTQNALRFAFALPSYDGSEAHRYQVRLDGFDREWSAWSAETQKDYANLPPGEYVFRARAIDAYGRTRDAAAFSFLIAAPWYQTGWAYLLFGIGALALIAAAVYGGSRYRMRRLTTRNEWLEGEVQQRTKTLAQANRRLEQVLAQNSEFLSIAAHDLKNPLMSIIGFSDILLEENMDEADRAEFLSLIRESAGRMHTIIRQLQDTELLEKGQLELHLRRMDLSELAAAVARRNEVLALAKSITLHLECSSPVYATVDEQYLPRILDNLLSNAIKFSPSGTNVWLRLHAEDDQAVIVVEDEGPGLTEADQAQMFAKLQRLSARPTNGESSTGLGLYIVRTLVELHGGTIRVDSEPDRRTTFTVRLPAAACEAREVAHEKHDREK